MTANAPFRAMSIRHLLLLLYLLSGAAALLYQVVWSRLLTLYMGHTVGAVGTVLAAFMGGLAIGAWLAGRLAPSLPPTRALRTYAWLELTIGACALLLPLVLSSAHPVLAWAYRNGEGGPVFDLTRVTLSLVLLSVPTVAMGATYPIAVRWFAAHADVAAARASGLYAANTIGAAAGAGLSGFVLLPALGLHGTTLVGVALNTVAALGALLLVARTETIRPEAAADAAAGPRSAASPTRPRDARAPRDSRRGVRSHSTRRSTAVPDARVIPGARLRLAAGAVGVSGFVALVFEVTWTRILAMVLGPTAYAFSAMLVAFITGLAMGSTAAAALLRRIRRPGAWLGIAIIAAAVAALFVCWRTDRLPLTIAATVARPDVQFTSVLAVQTAQVIVLLLPMAIAFGAAFPFAIALATRGVEHAPRDVAVVYATNTVGAIAGSLAGSFLLIPALGLQTTVRVAGLLAIAAGLVVWWLSSPTRVDRITATVAATIATALAVSIPPWNREILSSGAYKYAAGMAETDFSSILGAGDLLYYREGAAGTISVKQLGGAISLAIDGKVDASNSVDMLTQKLLAHLPLLLHPDPRSVCVIGLGSGVTLGAALRHPIERADVLEISPQVVEASEHFVTENHHALRDRRTRLIVGDGRSHLLLSSDRYDVIISEPSNPWMAGVSTLFTREFFQGARQRLAPGGILCQWAHTYQISDEDLRSIVATFLSVFPSGTAWLVGASDILLIGSTGPLEALDRGLSDPWDRPGLAADLAEVGIRDPFSVLTLFVARGRDLGRYAGNALVQSDDRPSLEYSAPRAIYGRFQRSNVAKLRELAARSERPPAVAGALARPTAAERRNRGLMQLQAGAHELAYDDFRQVVADDPGDVAALEGLVRAAVGAGRLDDAIAFLTELSATSPSVPVLLELSRIFSSLDKVEEAVAAAQQAESIDPGNLSTLEQLASISAARGHELALERAVHALELEAPDRPSTPYYQAWLHFLRGDFARAAEIAERVVALDAANAQAFNLLGAIYVSLGLNDRARQAFETSLRLKPRDQAVLVNLGRIELRLANPAAAAEHFAEALYFYPNFAPALSGLADALEQQGHPSRAARIRQQLPAR